LKGLQGEGNSVEDCLYKAKWGIEEHIALLKERGLTVPKVKVNPSITIRNAKKLTVLNA
jgi:predicted RNase H-like HicB family nuclease